MKVLVSLAVLVFTGCASKIRVNEHADYAYIFTEHLKRTSECNGTALIIAGVKQDRRIALDMYMNSIFLPKGKNYIYYNRISEHQDRDKCILLHEITVRHTEVPISSLKRKPAGEELEINIEGGKFYILKYVGGHVELVEYVP